MSAQFLLTASILIATASWATFLVWYSVRAKWWKHSVGWNTFGVSLMLFLILLRLSILRAHPTANDGALPGIVIYTMTAALAVQRVVFMEKAQRENRTKRSL